MQPFNDPGKTYLVVFFMLSASWGCLPSHLWLLSFLAMGAFMGSILSPSPELLFHFALELALPLLEGLLQWAMIPKRLMKETLGSTGSTIEHEYRFPNFSLQLLPMFQKTWQSSTLPGKETDVCAFPRPCSNGEKRSSKVREDGSNL